MNMIYGAFAGLVLLGAAGIAEAGEFRQTTGAVAEGRYIVLFDDFDVAGANALIDAFHQEADLKRFKIEQVWKDALFGAAISGIDEAAARELANMPGVRYVEQDSVVSTGAVQLSPPSWGLDRVDQRFLPLSNSYTYDYVGGNTTIYFLENWMDTSPSEFNNMFGMVGGVIKRASNIHDAVGDAASCPGGLTQHATGVAAIAAGRNYGVAKNAQIRVVRVENCIASILMTNVISGLNWVAANAVPPAVINLSIFLDYSVALDAALSSTYSSGIFISALAGNMGFDACDFQPTTSMRTALYTVAGTDNSVGVDSHWYGVFGTGSGWGACVDIYAPARAVPTIGDAGATWSMTGTSASAAFVSGAAALILNEFPTYTPAQVAATLNARATSGVVTSVPAGTVNRLLYTRP